MTSDGLAFGIVLVGTVMVVATMLMLGLHGLWRHRRLRRRARIQAPAREALIRMLVSERVEQGASSHITRIPMRERINLFTRTAQGIQGGTGQTLTDAADTAGLFNWAAARCRSRAWYNRLQGARLFTQLGGGEDSVPRLLRDRHPAVRRQAAEWAGAHPEARTVGTLLDLLADPDEKPHDTYYDALLRLGPRISTDLEQHLGDRRGDALVPLLRLAGAIPSRIHEPHVLRHANDPDPAVREAAALALGRAGGSGAETRLCLMLDDDAAPVRTAAVRGLGAMGGGRSVSALVHSARKDIESVAFEAVDVLARVGPHGIVHLRQIIRDATWANDRGLPLVSDEHGRDAARSLHGLQGSCARSLTPSRAAIREHAEGLIKLWEMAPESLEATS